MTARFYDGGFVFPQTVNTGKATIGDDGTITIDKELIGGMTLRDWFAGQASEADIRHHQCFIGDSGDFRYSREEARYRYADAMIAARGVKL
jgi:hypothetical protein